MKKRIIGIDVARALAVIGMIVVNFKVVFGDKGQPWLKSLAGIFDGKAAATFVFLAGLGLALMTKTALTTQDKAKLKVARLRIAKRALFLFIIGLSYISIWPADILHFYGVYMVVTLMLLTAKPKVLLLASLGLIIGFPLLMAFFNYETGWDFTNLTYLDFWSLPGFVRNLFYNGFHPVIPWTAFMLVGYWFGQQDLHNPKLIKKTFWISILVFLGIQLCSYFSIALLSGGHAATALALSEILGTHPMPPLPLYMFNGISFALALSCGCIWVCNQFNNNSIIKALHKTGQLALTFYVAHVIVGMGLVEVFGTTPLGAYPLTFALSYALVFSICCVLFAVLWSKYRSIGPLEWIMRKLTN